MLYKEKEVDFDSGIDEALRLSEENLKKLKSIDAEAKARGTIMYRFFYVSVADGRVFYQVTRVKSKTAVVTRCAGICLDEYADDYLGDEQEIELKFVEDKIKNRDVIEKLFGQ